MTRSITACIAGAALVLAGCGSSTGDRAISGAGIGAVAGTVLGAVTGLSLLQGALIGAGVGGLTGALTSQDMINLGDPIWATNEQPANKAAVARVQAGLHKLGYDPGQVDGVMGASTDSAIRAYQSNNKLLVDGRPTYELAQHIEGQLKTSTN